MIDAKRNALQHLGLVTGEVNRLNDGDFGTNFILKEFCCCGNGVMTSYWPLKWEEPEEKTINIFGYKPVTLKGPIAVTLEPEDVN